MNPITLIYDAANNLALDLYLPSSGSNFPLIVVIHGGQWQYGNRMDTPCLADVPALLSAGYACASVDYRLSPTVQFPTHLLDINTAVDYLKNNAAAHNLDTSRLGCYGSSAGAHLGAWLAGGFQAVATIGAPFDLTAKWLLSEPTDTQIMARVFGDPSPTEVERLSWSPIAAINTSTPPHLILHGEQDDKINPDQATRMYTRLVQAGVSTQMRRVKNGSHILEPVGAPMQPTRAKITERVVAFFMQWV